MKQDVAIDPRSFHVFKFGSKQLLFDRATGVTLKLNDLAFRFLSLLEHHDLDSSVQQLQVDFPGITGNELVEILADFRRRGFFVFEPVVQSEQAENLVGLWEHKPRRIQMLMAQGCNLGCRYCYAWRNGSNQKHTLMPWNVARQAVDYLVWRSGPRPELQITFFGGEPLLNWPTIKKIVEYCRTMETLGRKRFTFELITNGTLLDAEVTDFIVKEKFLLFISIDGWKEMHNHNRPSLAKGDLHGTIVANAQYAYDQYRKHGLSAPKIRANLTNAFHDTAAVAAYLESLGFTNIGIGAIEPLSHQDNSPSAVTEDQADELHEEVFELLLAALEKLKKGEKLAPYIRKLFYKSYQPLDKRSTLGITCGIGRNTLVVDNKGKLFPCHRYEGMNAYVIGDVFTGLDREKTMNYYRQVNGHATENCADCWIRDYCGGGCAWLLSTQDGHIADPTPRECNRRRSAVERTLWLRTELREHLPHLVDDGSPVTLSRTAAHAQSTRRTANAGGRRISLPVLATGQAGGCSA